MERLARSDLELGAVVHPHGHPSFEHVADVLHLARVGPGERLDVLRPPPAGLERADPDHVAVEVDEPNLPLTLGELAHLVGLIEGLADQMGRMGLSHLGPSFLLGAPKLLLLGRPRRLLNAAVAPALRRR